MNLNLHLDFHLDLNLDLNLDLGLELHLDLHYLCWIDLYQSLIQTINKNYWHNRFEKQKLSCKFQKINVVSIKKKQ